MHSYASSTCSQCGRTTCHTVAASRRRLHKTCPADPCCPRALLDHMSTYYPNIARSFAVERMEVEPCVDRMTWRSPSDDDDDEFDEDTHPIDHDALTHACTDAFQLNRIEEEGKPCEIMCLLFAYVLQDREAWFIQHATPWRILHLFLNMHHYLLYGEREPDSNEFRYYCHTFIPMLHWTFHHNISRQRLQEILQYAKTQPKHIMLTSLIAGNTYFSQLVNDDIVYECACHNNME